MRLTKGKTILVGTLLLAAGAWLIGNKRQPGHSGPEVDSRIVRQNFPVKPPAHVDQTNSVLSNARPTAIPAPKSIPKAPAPAHHFATAISTLPLDLSRPPSTEELMAAGQLGGLLYPTKVLQDPARDEAARWAFGRAIDEWNRHEYPTAVQDFKAYTQQYPDSPFADEATLHVGCDATYNGNYPVAESTFTQLIAANQGSDDPGAKMMWSKATQRLALVKVEENNLDEANKLFLDLKQNSSDFQLRTYAAHWLQRLSGYSTAKEALLNCGAVALAYVLERDGHATAAASVRKQIPKTMHGHSMADLMSLAADQGYEASARHLETADLSKVPLPCVLHINQGSTGDKGHYWVLDKVVGNNVELFDPQSRRRFHQTIDQLEAQWSGNVLVFANGNDLPGRKLDMSELENSLGGCCGAPAAPSNQGNPGRNGANGSGGNGNPCGAPTWSVNMINMDFYATDTPMWFDPSIGPPVRISLSYNSQSSISHYEPFGNKWTFNYGGYLIMDTSGAITVFMPDGEMDTYTPNGSGGYTRPYRVYNTLVSVGPNHYQLQFPDGTIYVYQIPAGTASQQPFLTEIDDAYGQKLSLGYNSNVQLTTITDAQGHVFTLSYNVAGLVTNVADPFGRNATFQYDANNNLTKITDMGGYWSSLTYDTNAFITSISDDRGTTSFRTELPGPEGDNSNNYPPPGDPNMFACYRITVTNAIGGLEEFFYYGGCDIDGYGGCGGYSWYVSPRDYIPWQSQTINNYRSEAPKTRYLPTRVGSGQQGEFAEILHPQGDYFQYSYDSVTGDRLTVADSHGYTWRYTYNSLGLPTSVTDARANSTSLTYASNGFDLLAISNGLGQIALTYNTSHSVLTLADHLTNTTTFSYNSYGQVLNQLDALGIANQYNYDANNRLSTLSRAGQILLSLTYDSVGRLLSSADATGLSVTNNYDNLNRVVRTTYPDGKFEGYVYSTCCPHLLDSITARSGRTENFVYDNLKRIIQTINPEGGVIQMNYDANGNMTNLVDPNGNATGFTYDHDDRLTRKTYPDGKGVSLSYDQGGFLTGSTNARGIVGNYTYDQNQNLLTSSYTDGTPGVTNSYDVFNRPITSIDAVGTNYYSYDDDSRLTNYVGPWANDSIAYAYDALSRRTNVAVFGSQPVVYAFDTLNRLVTVNVGAAGYSYSYSGANPLLQSLNRPNGSYTIYQYDAVNRLLTLANINSSTQIINSFGYSYNAQDLRSAETISNGVFAPPAGSQLTTNSFNTLNQQLASSQSNSVFAYDADGNMTQGYTPAGYLFKATYDAKSRIKVLTYTNASGVLLSNQYIYNGGGFLAEIKQYQNGSILYDGRFVRCGYFILQERDSSNNVTRAYTWGIDSGGGIGGLLDLAQGGQSYSYLYDGKGNVFAALDASQAVAANYQYDPFGVVTIASGTISQPFQFSTKRFDGSTGFVDYGFRQYSPMLGRWLNRDPIGELDNLNLYGFVSDNSISRTDPFGLLTIPGIGWVDLGECGGQQALQFYAGVLADPNSPWWQKAGAGVGGFFAALWTPETSDQTTLVLGTALSGAGLVGDIGSAGDDLITVSRWGREGLQPGDWVMPGEADWNNYLRSFKWQPGGGNQFAPFESGSSYQVPASSVKWPSGWGVDGWWKGIFGQRRYIP